MTDAAPYERYKEALRRGHVAAMRGRLDLAVEAYREASAIAPDRALPYVGLGGALARLGRTDEALAAFDAGLDRAPTDEGALRGRADLLTAAGRRTDAADALDRLAASLAREGRLIEASDVACRALGLAESRARRRDVEALVARLKGVPADAATIEALERARAALDGAVAGPVTTPGHAVTPSAPPAAPAPAVAAPAPSATAPAPIATAPAPVAAAPTPAPAGPPPVESVTEAADPADAGPAVVASLPEPAPTASDPATLTLAVELAIEAGDLVEARKRALAAAAAHRAVGQYHAAMDVCYQALAIEPADPDVHLALAELYLDRGWRGPAADKLLLLGRLSILTGDGATRARLCYLAASRFPDDSRLASICA